MAGGFSVYFVRILFTVFVFLKRGLRWLEVFSIVPFMLVAALAMGIAGGVNRTPLGWDGIVGMALFWWERG